MAEEVEPADAKAPFLHLRAQGHDELADIPGDGLGGGDGFGEDAAHLDEAFGALATFDATFEVTDFHLYEHGDDGVWRPMTDFALSGEPLQPSS